MLGLGIIVFSSFPKVRDIERKAHLEQMLALPRTTVQVVAVSNPTILRQFESDISSLKEAYWSYLNDDDFVRNGTFGGALLGLSATLNLVLFGLMSRNRKK
jgi:hypothetical protein